MHHAPTRRRTLLLLLPLTLLAACDATEVTPAADDEPLAVVADALAASGPPRSTENLLVPRGAPWGYDASGTDLGSDWRAPSAVLGDHWVAPWPEAPAPLGYGESYLATTLPYGPDPAHKPPTAYFRRFFTVEAQPTRLYLRVIYDDAFVVYLNGKEAGRVGLPAGAVSYGTLATAGHEAEARYVTYDLSAQIPNLRVGHDAVNAIYVEVHQVDRASSDLVFDAELVAWRDGPSYFQWTSSLEIPRRGTWWFWDRGTPGAGWPRKPDISTSSTGPGPLGFGENYLATETTPGGTTTYFATQFYVDGTVRGMFGDVMYDDGFVAYLNGYEVGRAYMPLGPVSDSTLAASHEAAGYQRFDWSSVLPYLIDGTNTLTVEVHQASPSSSDLVFDLGLRFLRPWNLSPARTAAPLHAVAFVDAQHGFAAGDGGTLVRTSDGGETWTSVASGTDAQLATLQFVDAQHGFVGGRAGTILRTVDGGATWERHVVTIPVAGADPFVHALAMLDAQHGHALADGYLVSTDDGGITWTNRILPTQAGNFEGLSFADAQHGWVAGNIYKDGAQRQAIYASSDGGVTWSEQWVASLTDGYLHDVYAVDAQTIVAVGDEEVGGSRGTLVVSHDGGATWTAVPTAGVYGLRAVDFVDALHGWAVGRGSGVLATADGGVTWTVQERAVGFFKPVLEDVHFVDATHGFATGIFDGLGRYTGAFLTTSTGGQ